MTIEQIREKRNELEKQIENLCNKFTDETKCVIEEMNIFYKDIYRNCNDDILNKPAIINIKINLE